MKTTIKTTILLALFLSSNVFGQFVTNSGLNQMSSRTQVLQQKLNNPILNDTIGLVGSAYEFNSFLPANVFYKDTLMGAFLVRYNVFNDEMQVRKNSSNDIEALLKTKDISVNMNDINYLYYSYVLDDVFQQGYFLELLKGQKANLLLRKKKIYVQGRRSKNSYVPASPNRFTDAQKFFVLFAGNEQPFVIPTSTKKFLTLLPEDNKTKEYESYIKGNKIKLNNIEDLQKFFIFYNQQQ